MTSAGGVRPLAVVRAATDGDFAEVMTLLRSAGLPEAGVEPGLAGFYVAEAEGRIVGAVGLEPYGKDALLRSAVVDPGTRGTGIGVALVERILDHARERGIRGVYLLTTTADRWFPRFGFERIARDEVPESVQASIEFREACPASAVVMRKLVGPDSGAAGR